MIPPNDERVRTREALFQRIGDAHPQDAIGQAIPCGVYTLDTNQGYVCVGNCSDTPHFAMESIDSWRHEQGRKISRLDGPYACPRFATRQVRSVYSHACSLSP